MESYHMVHPFFTFHIKFSSAAWCDARIFNIGDSIPLHE
jgi:Raf kinase inhibitor-like YbhB/YbcL family protein